LNTQRHGKGHDLSHNEQQPPRRRRFLSGTIPVDRSASGRIARQVVQDGRDGKERHNDVTDQPFHVRPNMFLPWPEERLPGVVVILDFIGRHGQDAGTAFTVMTTPSFAFPGRTIVGITVASTCRRIRLFRRLWTLVVPFFDISV
jgi:hypothetical protein